MAYLRITKSPGVTKNLLSFASHLTETSREGKVLIVSNGDDNAIEGDHLSVPGESTIMFIHDGSKFVDIEAMKAPLANLRNIKTFEASQDLNIGNVSFTAGQLKASRLKKGRVPIVGSNGAIIDSEKLTYGKGVLSTPGIKVHQLRGDIDAKGASIRYNVSMII